MRSSIKLFHWFPRLICILAILFVSLFALDAFNPEYSLMQQVSAFFMHLVPSLILLMILLVAWKRELIGGIIFTIIGIVMSPVIFLHNYNVNHFSVNECIAIIIMITFPFILVGILFIVSHFMKKNNLQRTQSRT